VDNSEFFAGLPADKWTPIEHNLRKALLKACASNNNQFPLIEWIDRRIGGEVETRRTEDGFYEILLRDNGNDDGDEGGVIGGGAGKETLRGATKEEFFSSLSPDEFAPPEEALREAIFEFLATWSSPELATLQQLSNFPKVQKARGQFLPKGVSLKDWIEHRVGGEIEFRRGNKPGVEVIHLTPEAQSVVMHKFQQISSQPIMPPMGMPPMGMPPMGMGPPMGAPAMSGPMGGGVPREQQKRADEEAWFDSLPVDRLLPKEIDLREAIINWIGRWEDERPAHRPRGSPPHLADAGPEPEIRRCRGALLPPKVKFTKWIERRIGGEVELRPIDNGQHEVYLRDAAPPNRRKQKHSGGGTQEEKDAFFATLPEDEFSVDEDNLRVAILDFLSRWEGGSPPSVADTQHDEEILQARVTLLPKGCPVSFKEWIDRRIGGEIETRADNANGTWIFGARGELGDAGSTVGPPPGGNKKTRRAADRAAFGGGGGGQPLSKRPRVG